jgi:putative transposase
MAPLAEGALRYFDRERYQLLAWVIMPNHIHVLVQVCQWPLAQILQSWKRFIAREANKILKREGSFWEREYWDTYMRDVDQLISARRYIEQNPLKAHLVTDAKAWPWSSARFRDPYGRLIRTQAVCPENGLHPSASSAKAFVKNHLALKLGAPT